MNYYYVVSAIVDKRDQVDKSEQSARFSDSEKQFAWIKKVPEGAEVINALSWHPVFVDNDGNKYIVKDQYSILRRTKKSAEEAASEWNNTYASDGRLFVFHGYRDDKHMLKYCSAWTV